MISYGKLWLILEDRGLKKKDLLNIISAPTLAKLGKNENVNVKIIEQICAFLNCQPGDIMEYVSDEKIEQVVKQFGNLQKVMINSLEEQGMSKDEFMKIMNETFPKYMEQMFEGKNPLEDIVKEAKKQEK